MGIVLGARHVRLDERVAIKMLLPDLSSYGSLVARFLREARAAAKIRGEHVGRVLDVDIDPERRVPYIVMEFLEGENLGDVLATRGHVPVSTAVDWTLQVCEALAEAHALGIVHRDLKPANLFLSARPDGTRAIKVLDFGISKFDPVADNEVSLTDARLPLGTPLYMAPEQLGAANRVDARADIWALGIILYELVEGVRPFDDVSRTLQGVARPFEREHPPAFRDAILRCLFVDRQRRFDSVSALAHSLAPFGGRRATDVAERVAAVLHSRGDLEETVVRGPPQMTPSPISSSEAVTQPLTQTAIVPIAQAALGFATTDPAPTIRRLDPETAPTTAVHPDTFGAVSSHPSVAATRLPRRRGILAILVVALTASALAAGVFASRARTSARPPRVPEAPGPPTSSANGQPPADEGETGPIAPSAPPPAFGSTAQPFASAKQSPRPAPPKTAHPPKNAGTKSNEDI